MEIGLHSLGNLRTMEVIDTTTGTKLGYIKDMLVDCENYKIISILIPNHKVGWFSKNNDIEIPWGEIIKIGVDVILVNGSNVQYNKD